MEFERCVGLLDDVDVRLVDEFTALLRGESTEDDLNALRTAYVRGYSDALDEVASGRGGELCTRHGFRNPLRTA